jgi:hypothetical protein
MKSLTLTITLLLSLNSFAEFTKLNDTQKSFYKNVFPKADLQSLEKIVDPILKNSNNLSYSKIYNKEKSLLGYVRNISTTTGCNTACLPLNFSLVFNSTAKFITVLVKEQLTKVNHIPLSKQEMEGLILFVTIPPIANNHLPRPTQIVDAITMATRKEYSKGVAKGAALTFYRVLSYKNQTQDFLTMKK